VHATCPEVHANLHACCDRAGIVSMWGHLSSKGSSVVCLGTAFVGARSLAVVGIDFVGGACPPCCYVPVLRHRLVAYCLLSCRSILFCLFAL